VVYKWALGIFRPFFFEEKETKTFFPFAIGQVFTWGEDEQQGVENVSSQGINSFGIVRPQSDIYTWLHAARIVLARLKMVYLF